MSPEVRSSLANGFSARRASGCHLAGQPEQLGIGGVVRVPQLVLDPGITALFRGFCDVDQRFECLDLTEKQLLLAFRVNPVFEQSQRRRTATSDDTSLACGPAS